MNNLTFLNIQTKELWNKKMVFVIILLGIGFRLYHYFYNRSLWMDEIYLAPSLIRMNYSDLAHNMLDYQQKAPVGFLFLAKFCINIFGNNELSLRIIPLLTGIISLFLFDAICKKILSPTSHLLALCIFSFSPALIYHSVEIKQYATECACALLSLYLFLKYYKSNTISSKIVWGILGSIIIWFSFSVIFMLGGIALGMTLYTFLKKDWKTFIINIFPFSLWLISFIINYLIFTHKGVQSDWVVYWFKTYDNFMPFPPRTIEQILWFPRNLLGMMDYPLGLVWNLKNYSGDTIGKLLAIPVISIVLLLTGIPLLFRRNKLYFLILLFPVFLMLLASGLQLYPLLERFWVFIAPVFIILIAFGFEYYELKFKNRYIVVILFFIVICGPLVQSIYYTSNPETFYKHKKSFFREGFIYINEHFKEGDAVYNYWNNAPGYCVYRKIIPFRFNAIVGHDFRIMSNNLEDYNQNLQKDFKRFSGKRRVWLVFNNQFLTNIGDFVDTPKWYYKNTLSPNENLIREIKKRGKILRKLVYSDITIYLFDLS